jgi:hypothetical protein
MCMELDFWQITTEIRYSRNYVSQIKIALCSLQLVLRGGIVQDVPSTATIFWSIVRSQSEF